MKPSRFTARAEVAKIMPYWTKIRALAEPSTGPLIEGSWKVHHAADEVFNDHLQVDWEGRDGEVGVLFLSREEVEATREHLNQLRELDFMLDFSALVENKDGTALIVFTL